MNAPSLSDGWIRLIDAVYYFAELLRPSHIYGRVTISSQRSPGRVVRDVLAEGTCKPSEFLALVSGSCLVGLEVERPTVEMDFKYIIISISQGETDRSEKEKDLHV